MIEFPYDDTYSPPVPVCQVSFSVARTGRSVGPLGAILDTGADGTLVPQRHLDAIGARRVMETGLRSQWGERRVVVLYLVTLHIGEFELPGTYVVGDEQSDEIVLGRNVLNRLKIWLDGPENISRLSEE
jgi:predicted aspartyl protease